MTRTCRMELQRSKRCWWFWRRRIVSFIMPTCYCKYSLLLVNYLIVTTIQELVNTIKSAVTILKNSGKPITSVCSASELFICFITLASPKLEDKTMSEVKSIMLNRGQIFLKKLEESRHIIAKHALPFISDGCVSEPWCAHKTDIYLLFHSSVTAHFDAFTVSRYFGDVAARRKAEQTLPRLRDHEFNW